VLGEDELEDGIAQELEALIVEMMALGLVPEAGMRESLRKEQGVPEFVTDALFQGGHENGSAGGRRVFSIWGRIDKPGIVAKRRGNEKLFFSVDPALGNHADTGRMSREAAVLTDLELTRKCLEGDVSALTRMQRRYSGDLRAFLVGAGATKSEAEELLTNLWTDCITGKPLLARYRGTAPLIAWLKTVLMNDLVDRRRRQSLEKSASDVLSGHEGERRQEAVADKPLFGIMRGALTRAFGSCPAEAVVMLQLVHLYGLTQREVCGIWGYTESKVSRRLSAAVGQIAQETMCAVADADEWLEIRWEDFLDFCRGVE